MKWNKKYVGLRDVWGRTEKTLGERGEEGRRKEALKRKTK